MKSTGVAAITVGVLLFLSNLFSEYLLPAERDGEIVRLGLTLVYIAAHGLGALALVFALRGLAILHRGELTRAGYNGLRVAPPGRYSRCSSRPSTSRRLRRQATQPRRRSFSARSASCF